MTTTIEDKFGINYTVCREEHNNNRLYTFKNISGCEFKYPSVTTVTSFGTNYGIANWKKRVGEEEAKRVSALACDRGTKVHKIIEDYLKNNKQRVENTTPTVGVDDIFDKMKPFIDNITNVQKQEDLLYSDVLRVAGTVDCVAEYNGMLAIIDFKTSKKRKIPSTVLNYFMQCAAYAKCYEDMYDDKIKQLILIIGVDELKNAQIMFWDATNLKHLDAFIVQREKFHTHTGY